MTDDSHYWLTAPVVCMRCTQVMTLKFKRPTLLREVTISWWGVVLGFVTIFIGTPASGSLESRPTCIVTERPVCCVVH